jgi:hypothetical protein
MSINIVSSVFISGVISCNRLIPVVTAILSFVDTLIFKLAPALSSKYDGAN